MKGISVITICFNNLADLQKTCASIDAQTHLPDEHWVINGSTETAIENWLLHTPQPAYRKWINERDRGISDAFNKGIAHAGFDITHLLHAGDCYAGKDVLDAVYNFFSANSSVQWISGNIRITRAGEKVVVGKPFEKSKLYRGMRSVSHPTWFVKKAVYDRVGLFSLDYKIGMDYDLMCRIADEPYAYLDKVMTVFDDSGISNVQYLNSLKESRKIYESYFGYSFKLVVWQWRLKILHAVLKTGLGKWLFGLKKKLGMENW
jgi:glycosyltransferase involved in cell wall biosynthesis